MLQCIATILGLNADCVLSAKVVEVDALVVFKDLLKEQGYGKRTLESILTRLNKMLTTAKDGTVQLKGGRSLQAGAHSSRHMCTHTQHDSG